MTDDTPEQRSGPLGERIILVGVDASDESRDALRWAASYAALVGDRLEVVHAWNARQEFVWVPEVAPPPSAIDVARDGLAEMVDEVWVPIRRWPSLWMSSKDTLAKCSSNAAATPSCWWSVAVAVVGSMG
jgi:nucleotide-binding universal stress UspA family protein